MVRTPLPESLKLGTQPTFLEQDPSNNNHPSSSSHHQPQSTHPHKPSSVSPFMKYWLLGSTGNSPATTPEVSRASTPLPTPPHHHSSLPPAPPPTPVNPNDLPRPPVLPSRTNSASSITTIPKRSQNEPPRPMTASSVPSSEAMHARAAAGQKGQLKKGQSSSKSWDFLVHGALL